MKTFTVDGAKIAQHRELAGMTQPELARKLGVDQSTISHWEAGRKSPAAHNFKRLCAVLRVPREELTCAPIGSDEAGAA